jgi:acetyl-CoA carboxylase carboxyl transferase subunit alpha
MTAQDLHGFGVIDEIIREPLGGAHRDPRNTVARVKTYIVRQLRELAALDETTLMRERYQKFRKLGVTC